MKQQLRSIIERALRRLPVSRAVYAERDRLLATLEASTGRPEGLSATAQVEHCDPHRLEVLVPIIRPMEERTIITTLCRDADVLPKVANAGAVVQQPDGTLVQIMHNGIRVRAGGYYGPWMQDLIARCHGHHEPQEEVLFAEIMRHIGAEATMFELGGFWSFYSIWFLTWDRRRRAFIVEPDPKHLETGRANARLNDCEAVFIPAVVGGTPAPPAPFATEESGKVMLPVVSVPELMANHAIEHLDLLHCDAQGIESTVLESCAELAAAGRLGWIVVSTHSHHISGDPLTHQRCLAMLRQSGATILAEHDVHESFSGDGLIVAKYGAVPNAWRTPRISYNRYSESLYRNPLYDLAARQA
jgi:FkbM family methyltransferase